VNAVRFAPAGWTVPVAKFALRNLGERLAAGERPTLAQIVTAIADIYSGTIGGVQKSGCVGSRDPRRACGTSPQRVALIHFSAR
jgi:hypothetical protein